MAVKKKLKKRVTKKAVVHQELKRAELQVTVGRKHKTDVIMEFRIGSLLARELERITDGSGVLNMSEEEFMGALTGRTTKQSQAVFSDDIGISGLRCEEDLNAALEKGPTILDEAKNIIYGDRERAYGDPRFNLDTIAQLWTVYLRRKNPELANNAFTGDLAVTGEDVAQLMVLLKTARLIHHPDHRDSLTDQAGYAALQARIQGL